MILDPESYVPTLVSRQHVEAQAAFAARRLRRRGPSRLALLVLSAPARRVPAHPR